MRQQLIAAPDGRRRQMGAVVVAEPDLLTLPQVAERLQVSRHVVYQLIWSGQLQSVHLGRCHRIKRPELDDYLKSLGSEVA